MAGHLRFSYPIQPFVLEKSNTLQQLIASHEITAEIASSVPQKELAGNTSSVHTRSDDALDAPRFAAYGAALLNQDDRIRARGRVAQLRLEVWALAGCRSDGMPAGLGRHQCTGTIGAMKNKTVAVWLTLFAGPLGLHRPYLLRRFDAPSWLLLIPTLVGAYGVLRAREIGLDDHFA